MPLAMRPATLASLAAAAVTTGLALAVDRFAWEVELSTWLQAFDLGPFDFLRGWLFWSGVRVVAGAVMLAACAALWLRRWRLESAFVAIALVPDLLNLAIKEVIARPRPTADLVDVTIGWGGIQGSGFPSGHAVHAVVFYGFLLYLAWRYAPSRAMAPRNRRCRRRVRAGDGAVAAVRRPALAAGRAGRLRLWRDVPADADRALRAGAGTAARGQGRTAGGAAAPVPARARLTKPWRRGTLQGTGKSERVNHVEEVPQRRSEW